MKFSGAAPPNGAFDCFRPFQFAIPVLERYSFVCTPAGHDGALMLGHSLLELAAKARTVRNQLLPELRPAYALRPPRTIDVLVGRRVLGLQKQAPYMPSSGKVSQVSNQSRP